jgi:hypothetical protein
MMFAFFGPFHHLRRISRLRENLALVSLTIKAFKERLSPSHVRRPRGAEL